MIGSIWSRSGMARASPSDWEWRGRTLGRMRVGRDRGGERKGAGGARSSLRCSTLVALLSHPGGGSPNFLQKLSGGFVFDGDETEMGEELREDVITTGVSVSDRV